MDNTSNPEGGFFASVKYRFNAILFCNTGSWNKWFFDMRKYQTLSKVNHQVLAFWSFWWTVGGSNIPYLDLPGTIWVAYTRSGRGFNQGGYSSDKQLYLEAEYRSDLRKNGLLGFVLFSNIQSFSEFKTNNYVYWHPAFGTGLRIKLNKYSKTNIVLDYAISKEYKTYFVNISETF
jgi:hypothetical protein